MGGCMIKLKSTFFGIFSFSTASFQKKKKNLDFEADSTDCLT